MTITIIKGAVNKLVVTASELATNRRNHIYLFQFTCLSTKQVFYCIAIDKVRFTRYNAFCITETANANAEEAEVSFDKLGLYDYVIYENENSVLDPTGLNVCQTGTCQVLAPSVPVVPAFQSNTYPQYQIYGN